MGALLLLHLVVGLLCLTVGGRIGARVLLLAGVPSLATLVWLAVQLPDVVDGAVRAEHHTWVDRLGLGIDLRLDGFSALLLLLVSGLGVAVFAYGAAYHRPEDHALGRQAGLLALFGGSMAGLVLADDMVWLVTCWELTSLTSYLLIGNRHTDPRARAAALHALLVTVSGGLCLLGGVVLLGLEAGTFRMSELLAAPPDGGRVGIALVLVLLGAATKSAQYPFHGWLPAAMVAPTPVSAYLHSATMVKAGVYLLGRFGPAFAGHGAWRAAVVVLGLVTMFGGGLRALRQHDLKLLLAFGTISQLGLLVVLLGVGIPEATTAGCVLLLAHGLFKAALFFVVGTLDRVTGTRDTRELPPIDGPAWRAVRLPLVVAAASMAGVPLALGFVAKEAAYAALRDGPFSGSGAVLAGVVVASSLTVAYSWRMVDGALFAPARRGAAATVAGPPRALAAPAAVLAVLSVVTGVVPSLLDDLVGGAARSLAAPGAPHLALWHGWELPLALSGVTLALGAVVWHLAREAEQRLPDRRLTFTSGEAYLVVLRRVNAFADRVTGIVQSGSLPVYTGVILLTAALLPTAALLLGDSDSELPDLVGAPAHVPIGALLVGSALAAAIIRRRISAVLLLGITGYGMAALFIAQGAPDLALTQVTVETLSTVLFVLVLRHLPVNFERKSTYRTRFLRGAVATAVGLGVFVFALHVGTVRESTPVADAIVEQAEPEGHGKNVVNVILVDVRGLDTLGEITVLATAAIGMVALARAGRRPHVAAAPTPGATEP